MEELEERPRLDVLIVEDSEDDASLAAATLREGGYEVAWKRVQTAAEMLRALETSSWHLIVADYDLPSFSALSAFEIYRRAGLDIPFIIVSGTMGEDLAVAAIKTGVHDYITRGNLARLVPAVRRELLEVEIRGERARAEAALRAAYSELAAICANVPVLLFVVDEELRVRTANDPTARFNVGEAIGCLNALVDPQGCGHGSACRACPLREAALDTLRNGKAHRDIEAWVPLSVAGRREDRCLLVSTALIGSDSPKKALICAHDVTGLKRAEVELQQSYVLLESRNAELVALNRDLDCRLDELQTALAEKDVLFKEVQHRVKNNLQVISSLLSLQAGQTGSETARTVLAESRDRVRSMALIHEQLTYSGRLAEIDFAQYVDRLVRYLVDGYGADPARIQTIADVDVMLTLDQAVPCGLILQELISNTLKHAFPDGAAGKIWIEFHDRNGTYVLRYRDNGVGLPPSFDIRRTQSLGTQLISDLTAQLGAEARYSSSAGLSVELMFAARERQSDSSLA